MSMVYLLPAKVHFRTTAPAVQIAAGLYHTGNTEYSCISTFYIGTSCVHVNKLIHNLRYSGVDGKWRGIYFWKQFIWPIRY